MIISSVTLTLFLQSYNNNGLFFSMGVIETNTTKTKQTQILHSLKAHDEGEGEN